MQSHIEVLSVLDSILATSENCDERRVPVISIAPQSLASLAASLSASSQSRVLPHEILRRIQTFFEHKWGVAHVYDTTFARHLALREHVNEFLERSKAAVSASDGQDTGQQLPMLASACPGWICYAEKAHSEMLPFIARTKSPQQVMGTIVKTWMGKQWGKLYVLLEVLFRIGLLFIFTYRPHEIYHVSVMPCYDKKLEASRSDFYNELYSSRDVDCVITTGELELMMKERGWDISAPADALSPSQHMDLPTATVLPELLNHTGSSSGSYLYSIMSHISIASPVPLFLSVKQVRNADYEEFVLRRESAEGDVVFKGAKCYGFRNLQNIVRKVGKDKGVRGVGAAGRLAGTRRGAVVKRRPGKAGGSDDIKDRSYDYVEVMACPGGCVNGGGQLKAPPDITKDKDEEGFTRDWGDAGVELQGARWGNKEWTKRVEETYWEGSPTLWPTNGATSWASVEATGNTAKQGVIESLALEITGELSRGSIENPLRTQYRAVEDEVVGLAVKW